LKEDRSCTFDRKGCHEGRLETTGCVTEEKKYHGAKTGGSQRIGQGRGKRGVSFGRTTSWGAKKFRGKKEKLPEG